MNILISVTDKNGLDSFLKSIEDHIDDIYATTGTVGYLSDHGIKCHDVSSVTGTGSLLDGRVKTLHPAIFAGILSRGTDKDNDVLKSHGYPSFDMVIANFYAFSDVSRSGDIERMVENIDIGGVSLVRAAAKNFSRVSVLTRKEHYIAVSSELKSKGEISISLRKKLATDAFLDVTKYDAEIFGSISDSLLPGEPHDTFLYGRFIKEMRYGENPGQKAFLFGTGRSGIADSFQMCGKELSYNNYLDADSAYKAVFQFAEPACVIVKHLTPCGASVSDNLDEAFRRAYDADQESAYGSVVAFNRTVDVKTAEQLSGKFVEVLVAPDLEGDAYNLLRKKKNLRILKVKAPAGDEKEIRSISGGFLIQDQMDTNPGEMKCVSNKTASQNNIRDLIFAWKIAAFCKSNAIVIAKEGRTLGIGAGQTSRVRALRIAADLAGEECHGAVLASDGFFPFRDSIDVAYENGIGAIVEPGGSIRDGEVIEAANQYGIALYFTGKRIFRH